MIRFRLIPPGRDPLARLPLVLERALERALDLGLATARARMGAGGPRVRSGRLLRSLATGVERRGNKVLGWLGAGVPYAAAQEYGAVIQARRRRHLRFRVQGRWVQVRRVVLPARPFLRPGRDQALRALERCLAQELEKELS